jgi:hypothetical protein
MLKIKESSAAHRASGAAFGAVLAALRMRADAVVRLAHEPPETGGVKRAAGLREGRARAFHRNCGRNAGSI